MKEQYIKQVEKELSLPHKAKKEVVRDLNEVFASALEHGETEQQVIQRLGTPKEFADSTAEQFGIDNASSKKRKGIISALVALIVAVVAFSIYAVTRLGKAPEGAIGQADATTNIQIESALDKGDIKANTVVLQLITTMEEYANYGFSVMEDKLKEDKGYFFSQPDP